MVWFHVWLFWFVWVVDFDCLVVCGGRFYLVMFSDVVYLLLVYEGFAFAFVIVVFKRGCLFRLVFACLVSVLFCVNLVLFCWLNLFPLGGNCCGLLINWLCCGFSVLLFGWWFVCLIVLDYVFMRLLMIGFY